MAVTPDMKSFECDAEGCHKTVKDHRWGKTKAEGWYFQRDGKGFCPDHNPPWVASWRAKRASRG